MKRIFDFTLSTFFMMLGSIIILPSLLIIWLQDFHSPLYVPERVGKNFIPFKQFKLRSMIIRADKSGVFSTSAKDSRITWFGHIIRRYKLDELSQMLNVFLGQMSLVGPRPNVKNEVDLYTDVEKRLLSVKPGITDMASIVFSDEGDILKDSDNPDRDYNQLIRPWKNRLALFYIDHQSVWIDVKILFYTFLAIFSRPIALKKVSALLEKLNAPADLIEVAKREKPLVPMPPPGSDTLEDFYNHKG